MTVQEIKLILTSELEMVGTLDWYVDSRRLLDSLFETIESLYEDEIAPTTSDILRRYTERNPTGPIISEQDIMLLASATDRFVISSTPPVVILISFASQRVHFTGWIDPFDTNYEYPATLWAGFKHFVLCVMLESTMSPHTTGGRYCTAKFIKDYTKRPLIPCVYCADFCGEVSQLSLGRVCHLVQCAITRGILCYEQNSLQPAVLCRGISQVLLSKLPLPEIEQVQSNEIQSIEELEQYLFHILMSAPHRQLDLSQIRKSLYRECGKFLNPGKLGFIKLSDIFANSNQFRLETINNTVIIKFSSSR